MKIFAKRSKKKAIPAISVADRAVLELLKKDPKELNAKERRQIKRYQDRIRDDTKTDDEREGDTPAEGDDEEIHDDAEGDSEQHEGSDSDVSAEDDDVEPSQEDDAVEPSQKDDSKRQDIVTATDSGDVASELIDEGTPDIDEDEVKELLEKLNSKNKRKLTRQLERDGNAALKVVREEALKLIEDMKTKEVAVVKEKVKEKKPDPEPISKKRKRDDWSGLPPEERLRREEQRAKQQEAAERRAKGETPPTKHKHPLNSERRRANRRKPKWLKKQAENPNEHDISGFHMRKITKKTS